MKPAIKRLWADMIDVRARYEGGTPQAVIAEDYSVSRGTVKRMLRKLGVEIRREMSTRERKERGLPSKLYFSAKDRDGKLWLVHRICWATYHGEIPSGKIIHHTDGDLLNNSIENLACMTSKEHSALHAKQRRASGSQAQGEDMCSICGGSKETHGHTPDGKTHWTVPCHVCCPNDPTDK